MLNQYLKMKLKTETSMNLKTHSKAVKYTVN